MIPAMIPTLVEAALRSVLVAIAVWAGLRVFRVSNVLAQKAAWGLVLGAAIFMPILLPVAARLSILPSRAAIVLPPDPETLLGKLREQMRPGPVPQQSVPQPLASEAPSLAVSSPAVSGPSGPSSADAEDAASQPAAAPLIAARSASELAPAPPPSALARLRTLPWNRLAFPLYGFIAIVIVFRIVFGLVLAFRIRLGARRVSLTSADASGLRLCSSPAVSSPVTIGSSVILPADYESWDSEKLRIVLAHERSHIRQGDFYLQLLAGLYAALFWFSPLGWWLKHKLSDLAEAISDRAGLEQAASRTSYAQVLLEFAAAPRPTLIGVAMARTGSISRRIERLLNDRSFRQAFAGTHRALIAVLLVPVALFAATALVRVQAAGQTSDQAPEQAPAPATAQTSEQAPAPEKPAAPAKAEAPITGVSTPDQPAPPSAVPAASQAAPSAPVVTAPPAPLAGAPAMEAPEATPPIPPMPAPPAVGRGPRTTISRSIESHNSYPQGPDSSYRYSYSSNGESFGIVRGDGNTHFSGDFHSADINKIRKLAHGDFLWFTRNGKSYFVDDPETVKQVTDLYKPMEALGKQQEELGRQQEELGKKQEELGRQQEQAAVPTPDVSKEIAEINAAVSKLQSKMGKTVTQAELADLQSKLGDLQGRLGGLQGEMGSRQGAFGAKMGELGAQQGKLGAQQGRLGAEQGKLAQQADQKVKSIIDQSLQNGKAHPVE